MNLDLCVFSSAMAAHDRDFGSAKLVLRTARFPHSMTVFERISDVNQADLRSRYAHLLYL
jgi:hypothetical protein